MKHARKKNGTALLFGLKGENECATRYQLEKAVSNLEKQVQPDVAFYFFGIMICVRELERKVCA
jgi:hypothetical protein